jgi:hypothetical protein
MSDGFKTPFDKPGCPTPEPAGDHRGMRGGFDLGEGTRKETAGGVLPALPTTYSIDGHTEGNVGAEETIKAFQSNRTFNVGKKG